MGAHALAYSVLYQSTSHHVNTDINDSDNSHLFETPRGNNRILYCFGDTITTTTIPNLFKLPLPGR